MVNSTLILNAQIVNEGICCEKDLLIKGAYIDKIGKNLQSHPADNVIDAQGKMLIPGVIDDQVHFREPGLTHKGTIYTESCAAVAGGVTSFMEMPNTIPPVFTQELLENKYTLAAQSSLSNFSFYMGASNDNMTEALKTDHRTVCGLKIFMGSSTGNLLVDNPTVLTQFFSRFSSLIAVHCEDEETIKKNMIAFKKRYGDHIPVSAHALIRSHDACYKSSSFAVDLAKKYGNRLHVLHISTAQETHLFDNTIPLKEKKITSEACVHHLWFNDTDYQKLGTHIKWNPAIKTAVDQQELLVAVFDNRIDVIASDHAPHTKEEKQASYWKAPSGGPLVQHSLPAMLALSKKRNIPIERVIEKMSHNPAILFQLKNRGFIREGYFADLVLINLHAPWQVEEKNIMTSCGWSPFKGHLFESCVEYTWVSGHNAYTKGIINPSKKGHRLLFNRE